jgi:hypothetical protein
VVESDWTRRDDTSFSSETLRVTIHEGVKNERFSLTGWRCSARHRRPFGFVKLRSFHKKVALELESDTRATRQPLFSALRSK